MSSAACSLLHNGMLNFQKCMKVFRVKSVHQIWEKYEDHSKKKLKKEQNTKHRYD